MSGSAKGQQQDLVDDSWEEIDEDRLAARLSKLSNDDDVEATEPSGSSEGSSRSGRPPPNSLPAMLEEELRPRMILQRPQMQILRRPQSQAQEAEKAAIESKPKAQIKSLDQRKQEYAEARLRILGSAHDEEEQQQTKQIEQAPKKGSPNTNGYRINNNNSNNSSSSSSNTTNNNGGNIRLDRPPNSFRSLPGCYHMPQLPAPHPGGSFYAQLPSSGRIPPDASASINLHFFPPQQQQPVGPHVPGGYHFQHHQQQQQHHHPQQHLHQKHVPPYGMPPQSSSGYHHGTMGPIPAYGGPLGHNSNNNVLRTPAGPDGSHGFAMRR